MVYRDVIQILLLVQTFNQYVLQTKVEYTRVKGTYIISIRRK